MSQFRAGIDRVTLLGLDFGSTTTSMLAATARVGVNCATGRMEVSNTNVSFRPDPIFTPFDGDQLDLPAIRSRIEAWLGEARIVPSDLFAGGAIVTGLAAKQENAQALTALIGDMIGEAVVATADDPRLESWLAFMGSCSALSRAFPDVPIMNLDIGGGTTNPALGRAGNVSATGGYFIGARHFRFEPGSYRLTGLSRYGQAILDHLAIVRRVGEDLTPDDVAKVVDYFTRALEAIVEGDRSFFANALGAIIAQVPFESGTASEAVVTFSGGVGELIYSAVAGQPLPATTHYGDLGIDLARAILASPRLSRDLRRFVPETKGRATVQGLTLHSTEVSGTTLFLPSKALLPLRDVPVVASLPATASQPDIAAALRLAGQSRRGACLQFVWDVVNPSLVAVRRLGSNLAGAMAEAGLPDGAPLVVLTTANAGKAIGNYATQWQQTNRNLIVIDEIPVRNAQFVNLGRPRNGVVPVSFYGMT